jgi:hypothetical protein
MAFSLYDTTFLMQAFGHNQTPCRLGLRTSPQLAKKLQFKILQGAEKHPVRRLLKNAQIQGARNREE